MNILWIVNIIFPYPNKELGNRDNPFGGWLLGLYNSMKKNKNIKLGIATVYNGTDLKVFKDNNTKYYLVPRNNSKYWKNVNDDFQPDVVHIHGTEYSYGYDFMNVCPNIKTIVSIQGLVSICSNNYLANINRNDINKNITFRDLIRGTIYASQKDFYKRGLVEKEILKKATGIIGRTTWDYANSYAIVNRNKYYKCNENLRNSFYDSLWNINNIDKNSIFISQAGYPLKGFHIVIETINILKKDFPDIKVYVAGSNIIDCSSFKKKIKFTGYGKYILRLIKKYNLANNIIFMGVLDEKKMLETMLKCNVFVQASSIENSSNSLGEAMIIGMPCVASNVGGTSDLLNDKEEGYLYPFGDYGLLAHYISKIFKDSKLSKEIGQAARKHALITHDRDTNCNRMLEIYTDVINNEK